MNTLSPSRWCRDYDPRPPSHPRTVRGLIRAAVIATALLMPSSAMALDLVRGNQLTVCTSTSFPPVAYSRDGELTGHDIAFLKAFAASRKLEIGFLIFPFHGLWLRPGRGECDIAASGITERAQRFSPGVGWSVPYYEVLHPCRGCRAVAGDVGFRRQDRR